MSCVSLTNPLVLPSQPHGGGLPSLYCLLVLSSPPREELGARPLRAEQAQVAVVPHDGGQEMAATRTACGSEVEQEHLSWHSGMPGKAEQRWEGEVWRSGYDWKLVGEE